MNGDTSGWARLKCPPPALRAPSPAARAREGGRERERRLEQRRERRHIRLGKAEGAPLPPFGHPPPRLRTQERDESRQHGVARVRRGERRRHEGGTYVGKERGVTGRRCGVTSTRGRERAGKAAGTATHPAGQGSSAPLPPFGHPPPRLRTQERDESRQHGVARVRRGERRRHEGGTYPGKGRGWAGGPGVQDLARRRSGCRRLGGGG